MEKTVRILRDNSIHPITVGENGEISADVKIVRAVRCNNFGHEVEQFPLEKVLKEPDSIPWKHKNGAQKTFLELEDHGTPIVWVSPGYVVW